MGNILVTGSTGGVGSLAISILHKAGYKVTASTGKPESHDYLRKLGADEIISRDDVNDQSGRPLLRSKWAGAVDTIGGNTLATAIKACGANGNVASCGLVASPNFDMNVFAFIIKNVNLLGIASADTPMEWRIQVWEKLSSDWLPPLLDDIYAPCKLEDINDKIDQMLAGNIVGRNVIVFD
jgi:alcohol dehydrogenase